MDGCLLALNRYNYMGSVDTLSDGMKSMFMVNLAIVVKLAQLVMHFRAKGRGNARGGSEIDLDHWLGIGAYLVCFVGLTL